MSGVESVEKWIETANLEKGEPKVSDFEGWDFTKAEIKELLFIYKHCSYVQYKIALDSMQELKTYERRKEANRKSAERKKAPPSKELDVLGALLLVGGAIGGAMRRRKDGS